MSKGRVWAPEWKDDRDRRSGVHVRQFTDYKGHSHHPYFTNPGWYDGGRKLLLGSDRGNRTNLFSLDLRSGELTQATDLEPVAPPHETNFLGVCLNPMRNEACFWYDRRVMALDLDTFESHVLWEMPDGFVHSDILNCTADGAHLCTGIFEDFSERFRTDFLRGLVGFTAVWEARPLSRIIRIAADGASAETVWEERYWIGHVNTSPTQPHLLSFCHEGPWSQVDNRIWGLDLSDRRAWMIRPRKGQEAIGHEYWHADGLHLGYHGGEGQTFIGRIRYDNTDRLEVNFSHQTGHIHSNDFSLIVGDAGRFVRLWKWNGEAFEGPRVLCEHRGSSHIQQLHVHPRFSPDGKQVLFTSDTSGYGNLYLAQVPEFESLPELEEEAV